VESGEGIESFKDQDALLQVDLLPWNPVKELKAILQAALSASGPTSWNPVKELKESLIRSC